MCPRSENDKLMASVGDYLCIGLVMRFLRLYSRYSVYVYQEEAWHRECFPAVLCVLAKSLASFFSHCLFSMSFHLVTFLPSHRLVSDIKQSQPPLRAPTTFPWYLERNGNTASIVYYLDASGTSKGSNKANINIILHVVREREEWEQRGLALYGTLVTNVEGISFSRLNDKAKLETYLSWWSRFV